MGGRAARGGVTSVAISFTLYPHGPHAMGLALDHRGDVGRWTTQLLAWLDQQWGAGTTR